MARSRAFGCLRRLLRAARMAPSATAVAGWLRHPDAALGRKERGLEHHSRRQWLLGTGSLLTVGCDPVPKGARTPLNARPNKDGLPLGRREPKTDTSPQVAIVGAGLAGLTCAYRLKQAGVSASVFDAAPRSGGRVWSSSQGLKSGQVAELGGEFIDTDHTAIRTLCAEFGLPLDDLAVAQRGLRTETYFFDGQPWPESEVSEAYRPLAVRLARDLARSEVDPDYFAQLDQQSIAEYLDADPSLDPRLRSLVDVAYVGEYGLEISKQSSFNLLWLIDAAHASPLRIFGDSDERFHVRGGNEQLLAQLSHTLQPQIELEQALLRMRPRGERLELTFGGRGKATREAVFDHVVLALPFTLLREVQLDVQLPRLKREIIQTLGYGTNAKLMLQFQSRIWRQQHAASGSCFTDNGLQSCWDTSRAQPGNEGLLTVFLGGQSGLNLNQGTPQDQAASYLPRVDAVFAGAQAQYLTNSALRMHWPSSAWAKGSYTCYLPGQARFSGKEGQAVGRLHFAGEHTSEDFQGYMNGAVESGERAASEIVAG